MTGHRTSELRDKHRIRIVGGPNDEMLFGVEKKKKDSVNML